MMSFIVLLAVSVFSVTSAAHVPISPRGFCVHEGEKYYSKQQLVLQDCQYKCECKVDQGYSYFMCEPLCNTYYDVMCADGEEPRWELEETEYPQCQCRKYFCPKRLSVAHFIDYGIDDKYFEPDMEIEGPYVD